ncbi:MULTISPECIES: hypothetical protein [Streptomyces]|uniref:hypothetical protein n=1 Tax=Streptomyces TaxID=1883 RepID=UPI001603F46D|nr:hypothetical protein [Streptomyces murinus]MBA9050579.1 hypothetical protein [Streptomyces murinus]
MEPVRAPAPVAARLDAVEEDAARLLAEAEKLARAAVWQMPAVQQRPEPAPVAWVGWWNPALAVALALVLIGAPVAGAVTGVVLA